MSSLLQGKTVIVTGSLGLIGKEIVRDVAAKGGTCIEVDVSLKPDPISGRYRCDLTDTAEMRSRVEQICRDHGPIWGLVNSAYPRTPDWGQRDFENEDDQSWRRNVDYQLNATVFLTQEVIKYMLGAKHPGSIVNIASIYGIVGNDFTLYDGTAIKSPAAYSAIKGGLINLTRYLASYYGHEGIRVNCVSPGGIFNDQDPVFVQRYERRVPLKRMGTPRDIAPSVSFLLSDDASYISGHNLIVDGGWTAI